MPIALVRFGRGSRWFPYILCGVHDFVQLANLFRRHLQLQKCMRSFAWFVILSTGTFSIRVGSNFRPLKVSLGLAGRSSKYSFHWDKKPIMWSGLSIL